MTITISPNIVDPNCKALAAGHVAAWQGQLGSLVGRFEIQHGKDQPCGAVHKDLFDGGYWVVALPRNCRVFRSKEGAALDYAGAGNLEAYRGGCTCGHGH